MKMVLHGTIEDTVRAQRPLDAGQYTCAIPPRQYVVSTEAAHTHVYTYHLDPNFARVTLAKRSDEIVYVEYSAPLMTPANVFDSNVEAAAIKAVTHP